MKHRIGNWLIVLGWWLKGARNGGDLHNIEIFERRLRLVMIGQAAARKRHRRLEDQVNSLRTKMLLRGYRS